MNSGGSASPYPNHSPSPRQCPLALATNSDQAGIFMQRPFIFVAAAILLGACAGNPGPTASTDGTPVAPPSEQTATPYQPTAAEIKDIQSAIARQLRDPDSARFGSANYGKMPSGSILTCGWVNSKNAYGGYTGMQALIAFYSPKEKRAILDISSAKDTDITAFVCRQQGISLPPGP